MSTSSRLAELAEELNRLERSPQSLGFKSYREIMEAFLASENYGSYSNQRKIKEANDIWIHPEKYGVIINRKVMKSSLVSSYNVIVKKYRLIKFALPPTARKK